MNDVSRQPTVPANSLLTSGGPGPRPGALRWTGEAVKMTSCILNLIKESVFLLRCSPDPMDGKQGRAAAAAVKPVRHVILPQRVPLFTFVAGRGFGEIPCFAVLLEIHKYLQESI